MMVTRHRLNRQLIGISLLLATGCALVQAPRPNTKLVRLNAWFDVNQARGLLNRGPNTIEGSALIRQQGGGVVHCGGNEVTLVPDTAYAEERMWNIYGSVEKGYRQQLGATGMEFQPDHPEYTELAKVERCDSQGMFEFTSVADGSFYVVTGVVWSVGDVPYGGSLMQRVTVGGGETKRVVLSP